jgi:hypothetical protein
MEEAMGWNPSPVPSLDCGRPHYLADHRACVLPVRLKAGKTYAIWLNSQNLGNFRDADGNSAVPYLLVFTTKDDDSKGKI